MKAVFTCVKAAAVEDEGRIAVVADWMEVLSVRFGLCDGVVLLALLFGCVL